MDAHVGDRLTIRSNKVGALDRSGTVAECLSSGGLTHYRVRWDDGRETVFSPGTDAVVERRDEETGLSSRPVELVTRVELRFEEDEDHTEGFATLHTKVGTFSGRGTARRNPVDPNVPLIGEELAAARALMDLAGSLRQAAGDAHRHAEAHLTA